MEVSAVIVSPAGHPGAGADAANDVARELALRGVSSVLAPDIYRLYKEDSFAKYLQGLEGSLIFVSWLQPRAAFWTLAALGLKGRLAERLGERTIVCLNAARYPSLAACAAEVVRIVGSKAPRGEVNTSWTGPELAERWYPVIDYDRCAGCGQCLEFCLFGVYARQDKRIVVANPDSCKPGCPACARVCPSQAIIFPLCDDAAIAGSDLASIKPLSGEELERAKKLREARRPPAWREKGPGAGDSMDDMIDGLTGDRRRG